MQPNLKLVDDNYGQSDNVIIDTPSIDITLDTYKRWFNEFLDAKSDELAEAKKSRQYYHGNQLSEAVKKALATRKQPAIVANFIRQTIDGIVGLDSRFRQDPKAFGRTPKHAEQADLATAAIRFVCDNNKWPSMVTECLMDAAQGGIMVDEFRLRKDRNDQTEIKIERMEPEKFFYDPKSIKGDFSDANYMGTWGWWDEGTAGHLFPDKKQELHESLDKDFNVGQVDPQEDWNRTWVDLKRGLIKIVEMWVKDGDQWHYCFFTGSHILKRGPSPFVDEEGAPGPRFVAQSAYIDEKGDRYSLIRDLIPLNDEINQRRSKMLHMINTRQTWGQSGVVKDVNTMRMEMSRPDGHVEAEGIKDQEWGIIDQNDQIAGQSALLDSSKAEMESFGPGQALLGQGGLQDSSGKALQLHLQAGMAKMAPFFNRVKDWKLRNYRVIWANVQKYWDTERYIMITDDPNDIQYIPINTLQLNPETGQAEISNNLAQMDVDIIIDESADTVTLASETFDEMVKLTQSGIAFPPDVLIEMSDLDAKAKKRVLDKMEKAQQADPAIEQAKSLDLAGKQADVERTHAETEKAAAAAEKMEAETMEIMMSPMEDVS